MRLLHICFLIIGRIHVVDFNLLRKNFLETDGQSYFIILQRRTHYS